MSKKIAHQQSHCGYQTNSPHGCSDPDCENFGKISDAAAHGVALGASHVYDRKSDALYVTLKKVAKGGVKRTVEVKEGVLLDFDQDNTIVGIEVLNPCKIDLGI